jgi:signal transduction histidine kinase
MRNIQETMLYNELNKEQQSIVDACANFLWDIWSSGHRLIPFYTDHGYFHSVRILDRIEELLEHCNDDSRLRNDEILPLILSVIFHDIGMQCDFNCHPSVKNVAEDTYGIKFESVFYEQLSKENAKELRIFHHYISAAWLLDAYRNKYGTPLSLAICGLRKTDIADIREICIHHSGLRIGDCIRFSKTNKTIRLQYLAALLRIADELDIAEDRVSSRESDNFWMPEENSLYWFLHERTLVQIQKSIISVHIILSKSDYKMHSDLFVGYLSELYKKNFRTIDILRENNLIYSFEQASSCVIDSDELHDLDEMYLEMLFPAITMDSTASIRAKRLNSYIEETRHDLSHRLQTMDAYNISYKLNFDRYFKYGNLTKEDFLSISSRYIRANEDMYEALLYMMEEMDSVDMIRYPKPEIFDAYDILSHLRHHYNAPWHPRNKGHELIISFRDRQENIIYADKIMFRRIVTNIVDNALKYSPPMTRIYISQHIDYFNHESVINVTNFGFGITEDIANKMFQRGVKGNYAISGKGLGLFIALEFAIRNNGSLNLVSGLIPSSGIMDEKKINGLVSHINFTIYDDVLQYVENNPTNSILDDLQTKLKQVIDALEQSEELPYDIPNIATNSIATTIMTNREKRKTPSRANLIAKELLIYAKHEIYQTTFQLRLPMQTGSK